VQALLAKPGSEVNIDQKLKKERERQGRRGLRTGIRLST